MKKTRKLRLRRIAARSAARRQEREGVTLAGKITMTPGGYGFLPPMMRKKMLKIFLSLPNFPAMPSTATG